MRILAGKPNASGRPTDFSLLPSAHVRPSHEASSTDRTINKPAVRLSEANARRVNADSSVEIDSVGHDFSRIPVHPARSASIRMPETMLRDNREPTPDFGSDAKQAADGAVPFFHDFGILRIFPVQAPVASFALNQDIPRLVYLRR